jgi:hypothetical protein
MNLTGCEIRFVLFGPDGRVTRVEPYRRAESEEWTGYCTVYERAWRLDYLE